MAVLGNNLCVINGFSETISVIDTGSNTVTATFPAGGGVNDLADSLDGVHMYGTTVADDAVSVFDTATNPPTLAGTIRVGDNPFQLAVTANGARVYVANADNSVSAINTANTPFPAVSRINVATMPFGMAVTPNGSRVFATHPGNVFASNPDPGIVSVIDPNTASAVTIPVGRVPFDIAVSPDGKRAYVANVGDNTVSVIDATAAIPSVIQTVTVGTNPGHVVVSADSTRIYVTNINGNSVSVLAA
jgi:YVTN family beta-propeller protein